MVASPPLELGLETVGRAGRAEDDDVLVAAMDDVCTEVMVEVFCKACGGKFCLSSARSRSAGNPTVECGHQCRRCLVEVHCACQTPCDGGIYLQYIFGNSDHPTEIVTLKSIA